MAQQANPFKPIFSIKDLEQFSGTKAHTIRIWEKRYGLLKPQRTDTNIRNYDVEELKVLLNVAFLNQKGEKISKIAALSRDEMAAKVRELAIEGQENLEVVHSLKMAMLSFDEALFKNVTQRYEEGSNFDQLVLDIYVPLLKEIGFLWATNSICPAHEHFISSLIRRHLESAIEAVPLPSINNGRTSVLYLPENELHELALLFFSYTLKKRGEKVIYLGQCVPRNDLVQLANMVIGKINFYTIMTATPSSARMNSYLSSLSSLLPDDRFKFYISGSQVELCDNLKLPKGFTAFSDYEEMLKGIED